jgi:hypothetical protein
LAFHWRREADHSPPSTAEVRIGGAVPPLPQYALMAWCSGGARGQLYLYWHTWLYPKVSGLAAWSENCK